MKVLVSSLVVGFALLIGLVPSSNASKVLCFDVDYCETKLINDIGGETPEVDCDECAGWGCFYNNKYYYGKGCKGDDNICKIGNNQNVSEYEDEKGYFYTCSSDGCAYDKVMNQVCFHLKLDHFVYRN